MVEWALVLTKLIRLGVAGWRATESGLDSKDLAAIGSLVETVGHLKGLEKASTNLAAKHMQLIVRAFGDAWRQHWAYNESLAPSELNRRWGPYLLKRKEVKVRNKEIETRLRHAEFTSSGSNSEEGLDALELIDALTGSPLATPYYKGLWHAFTASDLGEPFILVDVWNPESEPELGRGAREFERFFSDAVREGLNQPAGQVVRDYLAGLDAKKSEIVQSMILRDMSTWGDRHVFGNTFSPSLENVPYLALEDTYVEPDAVHRNLKWVTQTGVRAPVTKLVQESLQSSDVVVVKGDFGLGKSLTAKKLAWQWASAWLAAAETSSKSPLPVFVRCSDCVFDPISFRAAVRRALMGAAVQAGYSATIDNPAFDMPPDGQQVVFIFDGLDEVVLGDRQLVDFFRELEDQTGGGRQAIVFTRPAILPRDLGEIPVLEIQQFEESEQHAQISAWLTQWNLAKKGDSQLTFADLDGELQQIARTPILLFMIATTWGKKERGTTRAWLYEAFLQQVAMGKAAVDPDKHKLIEKATEDLAGKLSPSVLEPAVLPDPGERDRRTDRRRRARAMLWLMSRLAWEAMVREQDGRSLPKYRLAAILDNELRIKEEVVPDLLAAASLALQIDHQGGDDRLLFGHKSFREFLVARYWATSFAEAAHADLTRGDMEARLWQAPLIGGEDKSILFLEQILADRNDSRLLGLLVDVFEDTSLRPDNSADGDLGWMVRAAALTSMCVMQPKYEPKLVALRNLAARAWERTRGYLRLTNVNLSDATMSCVFLPAAALPKANLRGANLSLGILDGANLTGANLEGARLKWTNLEAAVLEEANLRWANLDGANLRGANLHGAYLGGAKLDRANLHGAHLAGADLKEADLWWVILEEADLEWADLGAANLRAANLRAADLLGANLRKANLRRADLLGANLKEANLKEADLGEANLRRADLRGADLEEADLRGATADIRSIWPGDFDPGAAGVVFRD